MNAEEVAKILDEVTQRLAPASEHAWNIMVTQIQIASAFSLAAGIIAFILAIIIPMTVWRLSRSTMNNSYGRTDAQMFRTFSVIVSALLAVGGGDFIYNGVVGLIIPEYHLLNKFLNILSGGN